MARGLVIEMICYVTLQDHIIKRICYFIQRRSSVYKTTQPYLVAIVIVVVEIQHSQFVT